MTKRFQDAFIAAFERSGKKAKDVSEASSVSIHQIRKLLTRDMASTNVDDAMRLANYFGFSLSDFMDDPLLVSQARIADLDNRISALEQADVDKS